MNTSDSLSVKTAKLSDDELKAQIIHLARIYSDAFIKITFLRLSTTKYLSPASPKLIMQPVFRSEEVEAAVGSALDFSTLGEEGDI